MTGVCVNKRSFLFLQGVASPFFDRLASAIRSADAQTCRVVFCGGDALFHRHGDIRRFTGKVEELDEYYAGLFDELKVSDIVLFGDTRPVHIPAITLAKKLGIEVHVYEEGYLRPDWVTLDSGGVNAYSPLANKDPNYFRQRAKEVPSGVGSNKTGYSQWIRLFHDLRYNTARISDSFRFSNYERHRLDHPIKEYLGWVRRYPVLIPLSWHAKYQVKKLIDDNVNYYVYPLQLAGDSQIRVHSPFLDVNQATVEILHSFAKHAPKNTKIIVKNHPLDTGVSKCRKITRQVSRELGIEERVVFIDGGHLPTLFQNALATVVINSTTGMSSLFHGCPTITLGKALYNMPGLTFQRGLDEFWRRSKKGDEKLYRDFRDVVVNDTQINGNFYTSQGIAMTVSESLKRLGVTAQKSGSLSRESSMTTMSIEVTT